MPWGEKHKKIENSRKIYDMLISEKVLSLLSC